MAKSKPKSKKTVRTKLQKPVMIKTGTYYGDIPPRRRQKQIRKLAD